MKLVDLTLGDMILACHKAAVQEEARHAVERMRLQSERDSARRVARALYPCYLELSAFGFTSPDDDAELAILDHARRVLAEEAKK